MMPSHFTSSAYSRFVSVRYESPFFIQYLKALFTVSLLCVSTKCLSFSYRQFARAAGVTWANPVVPPPPTSVPWE